MRPHRAMLAVALLVGACGCEQGPGAGEVRDDLQDALNAMDSSLVRITSLKLQGIGPSSKSNELIAYANVALELERDHDFSSWGGPSAGTLASTLGATGKGVRGIRDAGSASGDRLQVYASAVYEASQEGWRYLGGGAPPPLAGEGQPAGGATESLVEQVEAILALGRANELTFRDQLVEAELRRTLGELEQQIGEAQLGPIFAAGPRGGEYAQIALGLARAANQRGVGLMVYHSQGSIENARLVQAGNVAFGIVQSDILALGYAGEGPFSAEEPLFDIVALAALYPEPVHVVVPAGSRITRIRDLAGKRVALGESQSGTRLTAHRVLQAHGVQLADLGGIDDSDLETAAERLARGQVDAMFATIGAPAGELRRLSMRTPVRLLPLDEDVVEALTAAHRSYIPYLIPRSSYRGQSSPVSTVATTAVLVARRTLLDSVVESVLNAVFFELDLERTGSLQGGLISPQPAMTGLPVPLHLAAERFYTAIESRAGAGSG